MKIAVDGMGGDNAPKEIIAGVYKALDEFKDLEIQLFGHQEKMQEFLKDHDRLTVFHCEEMIEAEDDPVRSVRRKKDASIISSQWKAVKSCKLELYAN